MRHHRTVIAVLLAVLLPGALLSARATAEATSPAVSKVLAEGDRFYGKGQYQTAVKLYRAAEKNADPAAFPAGAYFRWGSAHFYLGEHAQAVDRLLKASSSPPPGLDPELVNLYLGYSLIRLGRWNEALQALKGRTAALEGDDPALQVGLILAGNLAASGNDYGALAVFDRLYREAGGEGVRSKVVAAFQETLGGFKTGIIAQAVREGRLSDPARGILLPWLARQVDAGSPDRAREVIASLAGWREDEAFSRQLADLDRRATAALEHREVKIGVLLPLSGEYQFFGRRILQAFNLALERSRDLPAVLDVRDTEGDAEKARRLALDLMEKERVKAVLGPILSNEAEKVVAVADRNKVPVLSPAAQSPALAGSSPWFFRNCLTLRQQGRYMAEAAVQRLGVRSFAILSPSDNFGKTLSRAFWDEVTALGGRVLYMAEYNLEQTDFTREIAFIRGDQDVKEEGGEEQKARPAFQAIYIPDTYNRVGLIAPQLSFLDIDRREVLLLGSSGLDTPDFVRTGEDYVEGTVFLDGFFSGRPARGVQDFVAAYRARYDETPDVLAAQAYDAAGILFSLLREGRTEPEAIRRGFLDLKDYPGVCGLTAFDAKGEVVRPPVFITVFQGRLVELVFK